MKLTNRPTTQQTNKQKKHAPYKTACGLSLRSYLVRGGRTEAPEQHKKKYARAENSVPNDLRATAWRGIGGVKFSEYYSKSSRVCVCVCVNLNMGFLSSLTLVRHGSTAPFAIVTEHL